MVDYIHYQDPADYVYGPEFDLEESLKQKRTLLYYVLAYATLPFLFLHVSLTVCLCAAGRRDAWFREGFFVVFIVLSTVDAVVVIHDNLFAYFPPLYGLIEASTRIGEEATDLSLLASDMSVFVSRFFYLYQALAHAILAANGFHAFRSPHEYRQKWRGTPLKVIIGVNFGIPLLLISFVMALCYGHLLAYDAAYILLGIYRASLLIVGALVGLGLSLITLVRIRGRSCRAGNHETTLTVHSAMMLLIQLLSGLLSGMELGVISDQPPLIWASLGAYAFVSINYQPVWYRLTLTLVTTLYCLGGSVLLLVLR